MSLLDDFYKKKTEAEVSGKMNIDFPDLYSPDICYITSLLNHKFDKKYTHKEVKELLEEEGLLPLK